MTAQPAPVPRQSACSTCGHESHLLGCDWCLCTSSPVMGVYLDPWQPFDFDSLDSSTEAHP